MNTQSPEKDSTELVEMSIELPICVHRAVEKLARKEGISTDDLMTQCFEEYLNKEQREC